MKQVKTRINKNGVEMTQIGLEIKADTYRKICEMSKDLNLSITYIVNKILEEKFLKGRKDYKAGGL